MVIPNGFYYEVHHPVLGNKAHFVIRYLSKREATRAAVSQHSQCALMTNLYVHPNHRGNGVGKNLLKMLRYWQDKTHTDVVFVAAPYSQNCYLDSMSLKNFYDTHGFPAIPGTAYHGRTAK